MSGRCCRRWQVQTCFHFIQWRVHTPEHDMGPLLDAQGKILTQVEGLQDVLIANNLSSRCCSHATRQAMGELCVK
jgi:hypothetical protein